MMDYSFSRVIGFETTNGSISSLAEVSRYHRAHAEDGDMQGLCISDDGKYMYLGGQDNGKVYQYAIHATHNT